MGYSDQVGTFQGERPFVLLELVIAGTTYRWSTHDAGDETNQVFYDGIILAAGQLDRAIMGPSPGGSDLQVRLANLDGSLDSLFSDWATSGNNIIEGKVTVRRVFDGETKANGRVLGVMEYARLIGIDEDRVATVDLVGLADLLFGYIIPPLVGDVMDALEVVDASLWDQNPSGTDDGLHIIQPGVRSRRVPVALGLFQLHTGRYDGVTSPGPIALHIGSVAGVDSHGSLHIVAVAPFDFKHYPTRAARVDDSGGPPDYLLPSERGAVLFNEAADGLHVDSVQITLDGKTAFVLVCKFSGAQVLPGGGGVMFSVVNKILGSQLRFPHPGELVEAVARFGNQGAWSTDADSASWDRLNERYSRVNTRILITSAVPAMEVIVDIARACYFDTFITAAGKLAAFTLQPLGGADPDYAGTLLDISEESDILVGSSRPFLTEPGERHGMINMVEVAYQQNIAEYLGRDPLSGLSITRPIYGASSYEEINEAAKTRHGDRIAKVTIGDPRIIPNLNSAETIARRVLALNPNPRVLLECTLSIRGTQLDLGDQVLVSHTLVPGWTTPHVCVVDSLVDDLERHHVSVVLVDYDDYYNLKAGYYSARTQWDVKTGSAAFNVDITNGSNLLQFGGALPNLTGVLAGDIFRAETAGNFFAKVIASVNVGADQVTLEAGGAGTGHEDGPLSSTFTTEADQRDWVILRSQKNRATAGGDYTVQAQKYACFGADDDGLFRDDTEAAYDYQ